MSDRRFTDKPALDPGAIWELPDSHPAMIENRTLFPSTVVTVTASAPERLLISGFNNRKIGKTVEKGQFKGYGLYCLSLEERATCPADCDVRAACYGNAMQLRVLPLDACDLHVGLGLTTRKNAEFCLLARRGSARRNAKDVREIILSPRREHSRKPDEFFPRVEAYCDGPRLELFARESRPGWTSFGNESTKFDEAAE